MAWSLVSLTGHQQWWGNQSALYSQKAMLLLAALVVAVVTLNVSTKCSPSCSWQIAQLIAREWSQLLAFWHVICCFHVAEVLCFDTRANWKTPEVWIDVWAELPYHLIQLAINVPFSDYFAYTRKSILMHAHIWFWISLYCWRESWKGLLETQNPHCFHYFLKNSSQSIPIGDCCKKLWYKKPN